MLQKPCTPRPGDPVCSTGLHTDDVFTSLVYAQKMVTAKFLALKDFQFIENILS